MDEIKLTDDTSVYKIKYDFVENGLLELNIPENITGIITLEITINGKSTFEKVSIIK